jgi:hypothetical protein
LIQRIRVLRPSVLLVSVDGPKISKPGDKDLVLATQKIIQSIDWDVKIETRFREENIGLRLAVQDSVNWAISQYGKVIVIEDDAVPGPQLLDFFNFNLQKFADDQKVMHVSGYNVVPPQNLLSETGSRFSRYPESFAWATWERAWKHYDENLTWGLESSVRDIAKITGSIFTMLQQAELEVGLIDGSHLCGHKMEQQWHQIEIFCHIPDLMKAPILFEVRGGKIFQLKT